MVRGRLHVLLGAVALLAPLVALVVGETRLGRAMERRLYDARFTLRRPLPRPESVVIVAVDLESEQSLGSYPWSRGWHTRLIRNLYRAGARVVAFDLTFGDAVPAQDTSLRAVIDSTGIVVLGAKTASMVRRGAVGMRLEEPAGVLRGAPIGIVDFDADPVDGIVREYPILQWYPQGLVPQLGVQAVLRHLALPADALQPTKDGWRLGERRVPRGPGGGMLVNFLGPPGSVSHYSYVSVVDDRETDVGEWDMDTFEDLLADGVFRDKIVLVGSTVPEHQDLHATPVRDPGGAPGAAFMSGVEFHAQAVATLLNGSAIRVPPRAVQYGWTWLLALVLVALVPKLRGLRSAGPALGLAAAAFFLAWYLFSRHGLWLWAAAPLLSLVLAYGGSNAVLYLVEAREKARIRGMFQQYVSASVVDELIRRPELLSLGGEERVLTVLFSDVVGFSAVAERLTPTQVVELLNEYLTAMTEVVLEHGGIIDKYQGDALMAEFGIPLPVEDHALRACCAALRMAQELARLREGWVREGKPALEARIGINTGRMLVGNLGSRRVMDYTVMGDPVNLASRLEGVNQLYGTRIIVSEFTWAEVRQEVVGRELDRIRVKGREKPVGIYEVLGTRTAGVAPETTALIHGFEDALAQYRFRRFQEALDAFTALAQRYPGDGPTRLYVERCREYALRPPPAEWDGVYTMTTK